MNPSGPSSVFLTPPSLLKAALLTVALIGCLAVSPSLAQTTPNPPGKISYQGFLTDNNGVPLGNTAPLNRTVIFRIFDAESGGTVRWAEQQTVTIDKGHFSVLLGEGSQTGGDPFSADLTATFQGVDASDRYVEITVDGTVIRPRLRLLASPYAFLARSANQLISPTGAPLITSPANDVRILASVTVSNALTVVGPITAQSFTGSGAGLTSLSADNITIGTLSGDRLPDLDASRITTGQFASSRIPGLDGSVLTTGTVVDDRLSSRIPRLQGPGAILTSLDSIGVGIGAATPSAPVQIKAGNTVYPTGNGLMVYNPGTGGGTGPSGNHAVVAARVNGPTAGNPFLSLDSASIGGWSLGLDNADQQSFKISSTWNFQGNVRFSMARNGQTTWYGDGAYPRVQYYGPGGRWYSMQRDDFGLYIQGNFNKGNLAYFDGGNGWSFWSDQRLKKDIADMEPVLDRALKIKVRRYRWKTEDGTVAPHMGVIAQEVRELFPDVVSDTIDPRTQDQIMSVNYTDLGVLAVKALQEFKVRHDSEVTALKDEIAALRTENRNLQKSGRTSSTTEVEELRQQVQALRQSVDLLINKRSTAAR
jgi:hypothetical protein